MNKMASVVVAKATTVCVLGRQSVSHVPKIAGCILFQRRDASNTPSKITSMKRGTGGRSSFSGIVATVFGASGFLGRYVCNKLGKIGSQVIIPYRCDAYEIERLRMVGDLGQVLFFPFELRDEESIRKTVQYSNVVINLVGRDFETKNFNFDDVHVAGARRLAKISQECGVERFIHVSHLNAVESPQKIWSGSKFLESKYQSELAVREEFPEAIIFKPADMFGMEDRFLNHLSSHSRQNMFRTRIPLWKKGEHTIKQPVYVGDVAEGIVNAIRNPDVIGKSVECVGPTRYYLADIVDYILRILRRDEDMKRSELGPLTRLKAKLVQSTPTTPWYTLDQIEREGITDWTTDNPSLEDLGVNLTAFDEHAYFVLHRLRKMAYYAEQLGEFADPALPLPAEHYLKKNADATALIK